MIDPEAGARQTIGGVFTVVHKVDGEQTGGLVAVADHILAPHQLGSPRHTHRREHEISYVIEGTLGVEIGGEAFEAGPGTTVVKPKDVPHAFWNPGDIEVRFVEVFAPGGFEHYFEDLEPLVPANGGRRVMSRRCFRSTRDTSSTSTPPPSRSSSSDTAWHCPGSDPRQSSSAASRRSVATTASMSSVVVW